ncbi:unnamed protein product [Spirodela intermedia]|uniref:Uncharacterized protein n=2 Tax=Spirodela intermedia TaxID=51605 RepID=A0A7I8K1A0_SPIIN|nr:unnamed protein product [Spirodela intermedia]CAA6655302.1 unnamed protein product [Spirodela intermedia]CAA7390530.1 unnamed protein product [Spirodela intermedia]
MENVQLEHENVTALVLVTLRDGVEEGRRFSNEYINEQYLAVINCLDRGVNKKFNFSSFGDNLQNGPDNHFQLF